MPRPNTDDLWAREEKARRDRAELEARVLYAGNPHLVELEGTNPDWARKAAKNGPAPTLFAAGDLPAFTASGIEPGKLMDLPWFVRHAAAGADLVGAQRIFESFLVWDEVALSEWTDMVTRDPRLNDGNDAYTHRFTRWQAAAPLTDEVPTTSPRARAMTARESLEDAVAYAIHWRGVPAGEALTEALARIDRYRELAFVELAHERESRTLSTAGVPAAVLAEARTVVREAWSAPADGQQRELVESARRVVAALDGM